MEARSNEIETKPQKRHNLLRHNRTSSDLQRKNSDSDRSVESSNGLKAVNSVTGALQSFFKWSSTPLAKE